MTDERRLMAVLAHPDDETLGVGGMLAYYAARGVSTHVVSATRGERGRYFTNENRPSDADVGRVREGELRAAAGELGVRDVAFLDYIDGALDSADPREVIARIAGHLRRVRPQVVVTFDPFGGYGHPDHIAISQFTTSAVTLAADPNVRIEGSAAHAISKLYYFVTTQSRWDVYQAAFKVLVSKVDAQERHAVPWPDWAVSARIDAGAHWEDVWRAVRRHETQIAIYGTLSELTPEQHREIWGGQTFYRVLSHVNGGRQLETDLFAGIESPATHRDPEIADGHYPAR